MEEIQPGRSGSASAFCLGGGPRLLGEPRVLVGEGRGSFRDVRKSGLWMQIVQSSNTHAGA